MTNLTDICAQLLDLSRKSGADHASASAAMTEGLEASVRDRAVEEIGRSETLDVGIRVLVGQKQACVSASSHKPDALAEMVGRAVAMAREAPEDEWSGLADPAQLADSFPDLDLCDPQDADPDALRDAALAVDAAALGVDGVEKSEGATANWRRSAVAMATSNGFEGARKGSFWSVSCSAIAGEGLGMERDYAFGTSRWHEDLRDTAEVGIEAGERAIRRINPRKAPTKNVPLIFEQRLATSIVGHFLSAINGAAVARGSSYLIDKMGAQLFPKGVSIIDDPLRVRGIASRPFDGEGLASAPLTLIEDGVLQTWLLDCASARQLGLVSTASASFGIGSVPRPTTSNVTLAAGERSPEAMIADIKDGFLVTEMLGASINANTGDYSRGASGFWIENGEIAYPVTEATVVGNLLEMFANLEAANDLPTDKALRVPTMLIEGCSVAGA